LFYAAWSPQTWLQCTSPLHDNIDAIMKREMRHVSALSRKLRRTLYHSMAKNGPKLERRQLLLGRLVDIGAELLAMSCAAAHAHALGDESSLKTARYICSRGRSRIHNLFTDAASAPDAEAYRLTKGMLEN